MRSFIHRISGLLASAALTLVVATPAAADDTEIFVPQGGSSVKPNVLFILDTSGSMNTEVITESAPYDPLTTYAGSCNTGRVYWLRDQGSPLLPPSCDGSNDNWFNLTQMKCITALNEMTLAGRSSTLRAAQFDTGDVRWEQIRATVKNLPVECRSDAGVHGDGVNVLRLYARDHANRWGTSGQSITWNANNTNRNYVFYSANYLNWYNNPAFVVSKSRLEIMQDTMVDLLSEIRDVNVGLMRYSNNTDDRCDDTDTAEGGMVTFAMADVDAGSNRDDMISTVKSYNASGCTPLSETLYESYLYLKGETWKYGKDAQSSPGDPMPSVAASLMPNSETYKSPLEYSCQSTYIVYLTDGLPTSDDSADGEIEGLTGRCDGNGDGHCLDDLAGYMWNTGVRDATGKVQPIKSYWIGFGTDVVNAPILTETAAAGGGAFYNADNTEGLSAVLSAIVGNIANDTTTFVAPSVSVNAFNRTQTLSDLYVSVFKPNTNLRWLGNIKKYKVVDGVIEDADGEPAIEGGFFRDGSRSFWSAADDDDAVDLGGAASRLPDPANRKVYTNIDPSTNDLTATTNALNVANTTFITDAVLGTGAPGQPTRTQVIEWARGGKVPSAPATARRDMGDPLHAKPAVVIYGGDEEDPDVTVFAPNNDGMLHAINGTDDGTSGGTEMWTFMPKDQLDNIIALYENQPTNNKHYSLDGEVRVLKYDVDQDGIVEPGQGDKVFIYFGQRRGGSSYYALDVTDRNRPRHMWTLGPGQLPGIGQTWSAPIIGRVNINGAAQNTQKLVLVFGGGYDDTQDNYNYKSDLIGNGVYMVDALTGSLLWRASRTGANLNLPRMLHSIPTNVSVLDLDGDSYSDRIYLGDMGGQIFRFDIYNGNPVSSLVTGGVIADLGAASLPIPKPISASRRLYNTPDVALMRRRGLATFFNIAMGSGYRGHPLHLDTEDRFYSVRDYLPFVKRTQAQYDALTPVTDANLVDITGDVTPGLSSSVVGWKLRLTERGEKVLAESRTFNNSIFFPTYLPPTGSLSACEPPEGKNRAYVINAMDGSPVVEQDGEATDADGDGTPELTEKDRYTELDQSGIAPETVMLFPGRDQPAGGSGAPPDDDDECEDGDEDCDDDPVVCLNGVEVLEVCEDFNSRVRTFWRETGAN